MALPTRTQIRHTLIAALSNKETAFGPGADDQGEGEWKSAGVYDSHPDPLQAFCSEKDDDEDGRDDENELPAVIIYTQGQSWNPLDFKTATGCFDSSITIDIEIYACHESGYELEAYLDELERQVLYKIFLDIPFRKLIEAVEDMISRPHRDSLAGSRFGMRRISIQVKLKDNLTPALVPDIPYCAKFTFKIGNDPETPTVTTGDIYADN